MKTDNSNIVSNSEIKMPEWDIFKYNSRLEWAKDCFVEGANRKEEQLKPLIESHAELLESHKELKNALLDLLAAYNFDFTLLSGNGLKDTKEIKQAKAAIEKANNILNK